jgi:predicted Kef-type K+ transport protein
MRNSVFAWIAIATIVVLLIPFAAMQLTSEVQWGIMDFIVMGFIVFVSGTVFVVAARKISQRYWWVLGGIVAVVLFYVWAELAVGIFTSLGN